MATPRVGAGWRHVRLLFRSASLIGPANSIRALGYAFFRRWQDRRYLADRPDDGRDRGPGGLDSAEPVEGGARFDFAEAALELRLLADGGIFVGWAGAAPLPSYALATDDAPEFAPDTRLEPADEGWLVRSGDTQVEVTPGGALTFSRAGVELRRDLPPTWHGTDPGAGGGWTHDSALSQDAAVYGLGGRSAAANRRPGSYRLWNTDPGGTYAADTDPLSLTMPVYGVVGDDGGQLAFYDNSFDGTVDVGDQVRFRMTGGPLRYYVFLGTPTETLDEYTRLTGRPALPPRWALGYHLSRWGYGSEAAVREVVAGFAERDLPLSGVWLDIDHLEANRVFLVDETRYPDLGGFAEELAESDTHLIAIVDPAVPRLRGNPIYDAGRAADAYCRDARGKIAPGVQWSGCTVYPDFTAARVREWWGGLYAWYLEHGFDGIWHDMNDPVSFAAFGDSTLPLSTRHELDGRGGDHREAHNIYGLLMNQAADDGIRRLWPGIRPFQISRSGWAGMQRYGGTWTGDIGTSWHALRISLSFAVGLGFCGMPYSGPDIGGFDEHPSTELFTRWFQLAAYLPFFRTHSGKGLPPREPWHFGAETLGRVRACLRDRYALLPYWYTLAWEAYRTGAPYVRPMLWSDPADPELRTVDDQFLLGTALLVAPVFTAGTAERTVRLPRGRWYDRRTGRAHDGPGEVTVEAGLDDGPAVFVAAGAVVPLQLEDGVVLQATPGEAGPGGVLVTDADGGAERDDLRPIEERFTVVRVGEDWAVEYDGPAGELPYPVRWLTEG